MCSFVLKEAIDYYNLNRGTVYCVMLAVVGKSQIKSPCQISNF